MSLLKSEAKEIEDIIGSIKQNFECPICLELMLYPVSTKCDHKFCRHCILEVIGRKPSTPCPLCKAPVTKRSLQDLIEWKNFVGMVKQLIDAFKLDLADEERVDRECRESAKESGECRESAKESGECRESAKESRKPSAKDASSTAHHVRKRRSVRFKLEGEDLNDKHDEAAVVEQISNETGSNCSGLICLENIEMLPPTNNMSSVTSDAVHLSVSKKTDCRKKEFSEAGIEDYAARKFSATGVESASEEDDDHDHSGLITGGYQADAGFDVEMRPAVENSKIFKSRALSKETNEKSTGIQSMDDPFAFIGSQPTPKRKKSAQRQLSDVEAIQMFEDLNVLPKRRKRMSLVDSSVFRLPVVRKNVAEVRGLTGDEYCNEIQALSDKFSDAESYNLVLSQQFRHSDTEHKKSQKPLAIIENLEQMEKNGSALMKKDSEKVQAVVLKAGETVQLRMVSRKRVPNEKSPIHSALKKVASNKTARNSAVPKVHDIESNETLPIEALPKEYFAKDVVPNKMLPSKRLSNEVPSEKAIKNEILPSKLMPSKTVANHTLSEEVILPNETVPNEKVAEPSTDRRIGPCLGLTTTSPNMDVGFQVDSGSTSGLAKVCETDKYCHSSDVDGNNICMIEQDSGTSVLSCGKSYKRRKCSELVRETNDDCFTLTSRDLQKTRSSSRRRSRFQTVETKWQKKYQESVAAKEERRIAMTEFDRLQDGLMLNRCTASSTNSGLKQNKSFMNTECVTSCENNRVMCLEEEKTVGEVEERPNGKGNADGFGNQPTEVENRTHVLEELSSVTVESSSQSSILCVPDSIENQVEENECMAEKDNERAESKTVTNALHACTEKIDETSENKSVKETLMTDPVSSEIRGNDVLCTEKKDSSLCLTHRVAVLENSDKILMQESPCEDAVVVPDDVLSKPKGKRKSLSLKASPQAGEEMQESPCENAEVMPDVLPKPKRLSLKASPQAGEQMQESSSKNIGVVQDDVLPKPKRLSLKASPQACEKMQGSPCKNEVIVPDDVLPKPKRLSLKASPQACEKTPCDSESVLSESVGTMDGISAEESQRRDSMAAPVDFQPKPKTKRKRKTFSLEASLRTEEKMNNYSLPTDSIDFEQVIGEAVLGMLGRTGADDDLSTQEIEMQEAVWKSDQTANRNSCAVSMDTSVEGNEKCLPAVVKTGAIRGHDSESVSTEEEVANELNPGIEEDVANHVGMVSRGNEELLLDHSSKFVEDRNECTRILIDLGCAKTETKVDKNSECTVVGTDDSLSSVHSNSYSLLQPPVSAAQQETCADLISKDSIVKVQHPSNSLQCLDLGLARGVSLRDGVESEHLVESKRLTDFRSDELKVDSETKSQPDQELVSEAVACSINYSKAKTEVDFGNQSKVQSELNLVMVSVPEDDPNLGSGLTSLDEQNLGKESSEIRKSTTNLAHQLPSTCQTQVAEENESDESDDSGDEITSPVSRINLTSSGNLSSESEMLTTQQRHDLEVEVKTMEEEIARLQAELTNNVKTFTDEINVHVVASEVNVSEQEVKKPGPEIPASAGQNDFKPNTCDTFKEVIINDKPESDGVVIIQDSSNIIISDEPEKGEVDELKDELKQRQSAIEDTEESSSDADLFGSQMSDVVAIPQTPTPTKDKTPRSRFSHRAMERDVERKENPRSPTPPPPLVACINEKKNSNDVEYANEVKRSRLSHDQDNRALSDGNHRNINNKFNLTNDQSSTRLKPLEHSGNYSKTVAENVRLVDGEIEGYPKTPMNRGGSSSFATTGKKGQGAVYVSSAVLRECSTQPLKEKRNGSPFPQKKNWILVASGINRLSEMPLVEEFVRKLGCRFLQKFTNGTTHVLVKPVNEGSRRCQRTLKYFQGIAHRSWVVSIEWVIDSIRMGCLQAEDKYEITGDVAVNEDHFGPTNARLSGVQLLRKFEICCLGAFDDLTRDDLRGLAEVCGASSLQDPAMFSFDIDRAQVIIVEGSSGNTGQQHFKKLYKKFNVPIVAKEWLLDSVGTYDVKSLDEYAIYPPLPS